MSITDLIAQANAAADEKDAERRAKEAAEAADRNYRVSDPYLDKIQPKVEKAVREGLEGATKHGLREFTMTPEDYRTIDGTEVTAWCKVLQRLGFVEFEAKTETTVDPCDSRCDETHIRVVIPK